MAFSRVAPHKNQQHMMLPKNEFYSNTHITGDCCHALQCQITIGYLRNKDRVHKAN
jgi:hypothetical protein